MNSTFSRISTTNKQNIDRYFELKAFVAPDKSMVNYDRRYLLC